MRVYKCDLCDQIIECKQVNFNNKVYDLCNSCREGLEKKLEGKGDTAIAYQSYPYITYTVPTYWWPHQNPNIWYTSQPIAAPTITYATNVGTYTNTDTCFNSVYLSSCNANPTITFTS